MSWAVAFIGTPEKVAEALELHSNNISGESKVEYDEAKPHLIGLVKQNFGYNYMVKVNASGHGMQGSRQLSTLIEIVYNALV